MKESDLRVEIKEQEITVSDKNYNFELVSSKLLYPKSKDFTVQIKAHGQTKVEISLDEVEEFNSFVTIASKKALEIYEVLKPKE